MTTEEQDGGVRARLGLALRAALRTRDQAAMAALRSALAAIANAEAVSPDAFPPAAAGSAHFAGATAGPGATEVARRVLSEADQIQIVRAEIAERQQAASKYAAAGHAARGARLQAEADVLSAALDG
jgi:uncharacterized protein YqeY